MITSLSWEEVRNRLALALADHPEKVKLYGIPRGGAIVAALAGREVDRPEDADLLMDDIVDSGRTREIWTARFPGKPFVALVDKMKEPDLGWVAFPWEGDPEKDGESIVLRLLEFLGENPRRPGLRDTPGRVIRAWRELLSGNQTDPKLHLSKNFILGDEGQKIVYDQMILSRGIPFVSTCEHHLMPFTGLANVAYIPGDHGNVVGLSKLARLVEGYSRRLQVQERLTQQIADAIQEVLEPRGVAVQLSARHSCQCFRGVRKDGEMITSSLHGAFRTDAAARAELFQLLRL